MSVAQQAIAARRRAKIDPRYMSNRKDAATRARKMKEKEAEEQRRKQRKKGG